ncbi:MGMT family protein [Chryseobacterium sp. pc1-10]|uniref:MGMT family protein n=1 Tax=Chryseobacterium herbae TaxID=2976476 RepID=A0ABT2INY9_9FLAO|nr:MGMT family protein [Chryseobacterium sp. pc1-10]MCT2560535.1 MGMT family protein [Chryseobacterium sp. pc1-10]
MLNGINKIAILILFHRVIGSNGELEGYAGRSGESKNYW